MQLYYKTDKLRKLCKEENKKEVIKKYGLEFSKKLLIRINLLEKVNNLNEVPTCLPTRRHKLIGNYDGCYAINITNQYRLIFKPKDADSVIIENLELITKIEITEVSKHYE